MLGGRELLKCEVDKVSGQGSAGCSCSGSSLLTGGSGFFTDTLLCWAGFTCFPLLLLLTILLAVLLPLTLLLLVALL